MTRADMSFLPAPVQRRGALRDLALEGILRIHVQDVTAVAFAPGGARMVSASREGSLVLWSLEDGRVEHTLGRSVAWSPAGALLFSADGLVLYTGHQDGQVHSWDVVSGSLLATHAHMKAP